MKKKLEYWVVSAYQLGDLIAYVDDKDDEGWKPQGGISVVYAPEIQPPRRYYQAIVREKPEIQTQVDPQRPADCLMDIDAFISDTFSSDEKGSETERSTLKKNLKDHLKVVLEVRWTVWKLKVRELLLVAGISLKKPDKSPEYKKMKRLLSKAFLENQSPREYVSSVLAGKKVLNCFGLEM